MTKTGDAGSLIIQSSSKFSFSVEIKSIKFGEALTNQVLPLALEGCESYNGSNVTNHDIVQSSKVQKLCIHSF